MKRLIDAEALKNEILDWIYDQVASKYLTRRGCLEARKGARVALSLIDAATTIGPVRHGHWIKYSSDEWGCSECMETRCYDTLDGVMPDKFCPNCGCFMQGENNGKE